MSFFFFFCQQNISNETTEVKPFSGSEDHTWVGPPHPVSNLRLKVFPTSKHLTKEEAHFYKRSKEIQDWNQEYWESHNKDFEQVLFYLILTSMIRIINQMQCLNHKQYVKIADQFIIIILRRNAEPFVYFKINFLYGAAFKLQF